MKTLIAALLLSAAAATATAGDYDISANANTRGGTLGQGQVESGVVVSVRSVTVEPSSTARGAGTGIGAALGAAIGSQAGNGNGRYVASALAGVLGGVAGNVATDALSSAEAQEVIVKKDDGRLVVLTQADSNLSIGQSVYLVDSAGRTRVIPR